MHGDILSTIETSELIDELDRRGLISIISGEQRVTGADFANHLGLGDELRTTAIRMAQLVTGRTIADDPGVQLLTSRKLKTSASEDISCAVMCIKAIALRAAVEEPLDPGHIDDLAEQGDAV